MGKPMPTITKRACNPNKEENQLRKGPWTLEEDRLLNQYISCHGEGRWNLLAKRAGLKRTGKSCRLRWLNYLKPDVKRGDLTPQEQLLILELHSKWGNRWSKIAQHLPGRTDNEIKNYWRTRVQKQARQLNIESNSNKFLGALRCYWMPRLIQKMEPTSQVSFPSTTMTFENSAIPSTSSNSTISHQSPLCFPENILANNMDQVGENQCLNAATSNLYCGSTTMSYSQLPEIIEYPRTPFNGLDSAVYRDNMFKGCYTVDSSNYSLEDFNLDCMSGTGIFDGSEASGIQFEQSDWMSGNMMDNLWNMDDIWQLDEQKRMSIG